MANSAVSDNGVVSKIGGVFSTFKNKCNALLDTVGEMEEIRMNVSDDALADATLFKFLADLFNSIIKNKQNNALIKELQENQSLTEQKNTKLMGLLNNELKENASLTAGAKESVSKFLSSKMGGAFATKLLFAPPAGQILMAANIIKQAVEAGKSDDELTTILTNQFGKDSITTTLTRAIQTMTANTASPANVVEETLKDVNNIKFRMK